MSVSAKNTYRHIQYCKRIYNKVEALGICYCKQIYSLDISSSEGFNLTLWSMALEKESNVCILYSSSLHCFMSIKDESMQFPMMPDCAPNNFCLCGPNWTCNTTLQVCKCCVQNTFPTSPFMSPNPLSAESSHWNGKGPAIERSNSGAEKAPSVAFL